MSQGEPRPVPALWWLRGSVLCPRSQGPRRLPPPAEEVTHQKPELALSPNPCSCQQTAWLRPRARPAVPSEPVGWALPWEGQSNAEAWEALTLTWELNQAGPGSVTQLKSGDSAFTSRGLAESEASLP